MSRELQLFSCIQFQAKTLTQISEENEWEILQTMRPTFNMTLISATMEDKKCSNNK